MESVESVVSLSCLIWSWENSVASLPSSLGCNCIGALSLFLGMETKQSPQTPCFQLPNLPTPKKYPYWARNNKSQHLHSITLKQAILDVATTLWSARPTKRHLCNSQNLRHPIQMKPTSGAQTSLSSNDYTYHIPFDGSKDTSCVPTIQIIGSRTLGHANRHQVIHERATKIYTPSQL